MNEDNLQAGIKKTINLFHHHQLEYNLFKCEHILAGENKNIDLLFRTRKDYNYASRLLAEKGFQLVLPEKSEKYKRMYVKFTSSYSSKTSQLTAIHLHREIAWHGVRALNKENIFLRARELSPKIKVPSPEDSLLIHLAHIFFENFKIGKREREYLPLYLKQKLDWKYINAQLVKWGWKKGFYLILKRFQEGKKISFKDIAPYYLARLPFRVADLFYLKLKITRLIFRQIRFKRKGCLLVLIGVNGAGKTTFARKLLEEYKPLTDFLNGQTGYYFGWNPFLPLTKLISQIMQKRKRTLFQNLNAEPKIKIPKISLKQELLFSYNFLEYYSRYLFYLYPSLRRRKLVVTDRYFYDLYGQYNYAPQSKILPFLLKMFPKPDYFFVLDASTDILRSRNKEVNNYGQIKKEKTRKLHSEEDLEKQKERYGFLIKSLNGIKINTTEDLAGNLNQIIEKSWQKICRKSGQ